MHVDFGGRNKLHATPPASTADIKLCPLPTSSSAPMSSGTLMGHPSTSAPTAHMVSTACVRPLATSPVSASDTSLPQPQSNSGARSTPANGSTASSHGVDPHAKLSLSTPLSSSSSLSSTKSSSSAASLSPSTAPLQLDADGHPIPQSLADLVRLIRDEMGTNGTLVPDSHGSHTRQANIPRLQAIMNNYRSRPSDWERYAFFDSGRYTRNLIDDGNGEYNLLLLCWAPGQASPIHDHGGSHCLLKVMAGEVVETLYDWPAGSDGAGKQQLASCQEAGKCNDERCLHVRRTASMHVNQVDYINDSIGIHRVGNPSDSTPAVTLHLYSPPIEVCTTFCEKTGTQRKSGKCVFFSVGGKLLNWCETLTGGRIASSAKSLGDLCRGSGSAQKLA